MTNHEVVTVLVGLVFAALAVGWCWIAERGKRP